MKKNIQKSGGNSFRDALIKLQRKIDEDPSILSTHDFIIELLVEIALEASDFLIQDQTNFANPTVKESRKKIAEALNEFRKSISKPEKLSANEMDQELNKLNCVFNVERTKIIECVSIENEHVKSSWAQLDCMRYVTRLISHVNTMCFAYSVLDKDYNQPKEGISHE